MDGGGLALNKQGDAWTTWRRGKEIFLALPGQPERLVGVGKDAAVAVTARGTYVAWTFGTSVRAIVPDRSEPVELAAEGGFAQMVVLPTAKVLAAWENKGGLTVDVLP
jgi:hypothetical protein